MKTRKIFVHSETGTKETLMKDIKDGETFSVFEPWGEQVGSSLYLAVENGHTNAEGIGAIRCEVVAKE